MRGDKMLREKLKEIELKITELADYLQISRPTMYKYIESYDNGDYSDINNKVLKLFNYIMSNPLVGKKVVINYIFTNLVEVKEMETKDENKSYVAIKKYILENPDSEKSEFIKLIVQKSVFDNMISYMMEVYPLLRKRKLTDEEIEKLKIIDEINDKYEGDK